MHLIDLLRLVFENLNRRKARVGLTSLGVMIGTAAVVILVSLAIGLQRNATQQLYGINDLTQIQVWPNYGEGGPVMKEGGNAPPQQQLITDESLVELGAIPGVVAVIPRDYIQGQAMFKFNRLETYAGIMGAGVDDLSILGLQAQEGSLVLEKGCVIIGALVPRNFYDPRLRPGQEMPEPPELYGKTLKLVLSKWDQEGNEIKKNLTICVSGIIMESRSEADWSIYMRMEEVTSFNEWFWGRRINRKKDGYSYAIVKAESVKQVMNVAEAIKNLGYNASTILEAVQSINSFF